MTAVVTSSHRSPAGGDCWCRSLVASWPPNVVRCRPSRRTHLVENSTGNAPTVDPHPGFGGAAERHRRAGFGFRQRRLRAAGARGGAYTFGGGSGSRPGRGCSLSRIAFRVRMRVENW